MAPGWFDGEIRETWPKFTSERYLTNGSNGKGTREDRNKLLNEAEIALVGFPFPLDLRKRSPKLKWVHQRPAGSSNMLRGDLWDTNVIVTSSRGYAHNLPIAEYTLSTILYFTKGLNKADGERYREKFSAQDYHPLQLSGKTICVLGAGGIGREVGRISSALGMRVLGVRRTAAEATNDFEKIVGVEELHSVLTESHYVAICCQWTPETEKLINKKAFDCMRQDTILINIARGEIIDEEALIEALANNKLRGVALDVYVGEFERNPDKRLWTDSRVLITPHISAASDVNSHGGNQLFVKNLKRYISDEPLENVIDWQKGY